MVEQEVQSQVDGAPSATTLVVAAAALGVVTWLTTPGMGHFDGALIPWPAHGLAIGLMIAASSRHRVLVAVATALALLGGLAPAAIAGTGGPAQLLASVALLIGQALFITLVYERLAGRVSPLSGTTPYAWMLAAVLAGTLPITAMASLIMSLSGAAAVTGYSGLAWWIAASSSGAALVGVVLALLGAVGRAHAPRRARHIEFTVVVVVYTFALASAFAEIGPLAGVITPAIAALPFLVWGGLRFGVRGYAVIAALLIGWVLASTWSDIGPFGRFDEEKLARFRRAWIYVASLVGPAMIFPVALRERAAADRRTRGALAQLRAMFESTGELIAAVDRDLTIIAANPSWISAFEALGGTRPRFGANIAETYAGLPADRDLTVGLWRRALAGERFTVVREFGDPARRRDELEVTYAPVVDERGEVVGASQVVRNVTERRRREAEEAEARRLESIGRLAGGVAHDFNNLMTAVMGYGELVYSSMDATDPRRADVVEIQRAAARAGELTQQLLAFARRREVRPRIVDVAGLLDGMNRLVRSLVSAQVQVVYDIAPDLPAVLMDPTQFEQVVMNLAVNARDAMPEGGLLRIEAAPDRRTTPPGLRLSVRDSGTGMPADVQERIFEPFFTTKPLGKGTGLGLSTVHGIVHQAKGRIEVVSTADVGTTFHIYFPAAPAPDDVPTPTPAAPPRSVPHTP